MKLSENGSGFYNSDKCKKFTLTSFLYFGYKCKKQNGKSESYNPELFTAIDSQKKSALTCFYHDISEEKLKPLSTKGRKNPLGYQLACFWDCQSSPVTGFIYSS